jgi:hypothetical protein
VRRSDLLWSSPRFRLAAIIGTSIFIVTISIGLVFLIGGVSSFWGRSLTIGGLILLAWVNILIVGLSLRTIARRHLHNGDTLDT